MMKKNSLLWHITNEKTGREAYVFGTMHVKDERVFQNLGKVHTAIENCAAFATEFQLDEMQPEMMAQHFALAEEKTLSDYLTIKQLERLQVFLRKRLNIDIRQFMHKKPVILTNVISASFLKEEMNASLDETLFIFAKNQDKALYGLETFSAQLALLNKMSMKGQVKQLLSTVKGFRNHRKSIEKLTAHYAAGNIQQLYKSSKKGLGKMRKLMLYDRNEIMANRIDEIAQTHTLFAAIGAAHLAGSKGVLKLLKAKGYQVKAVH